MMQTVVSFQLLCSFQLLLSFWFSSPCVTEFINICIVNNCRKVPYEAEEGQDTPFPGTHFPVIFAQHAVVVFVGDTCTNARNFHLTHLLCALAGLLSKPLDSWDLVPTPYSPISGKNPPFVDEHELSMADIRSQWNHDRMISIALTAVSHEVHSMKYVCVVFRQFSLFPCSPCFLLKWMRNVENIFKKSFYEFQGLNHSAIMESLLVFHVSLKLCWN